jgi:hypothetical protein
VADRWLNAGSAGETVTRFYLADRFIRAKISGEMRVLRDGKAVS